MEVIMLASILRNPALASAAAFCVLAPASANATCLVFNVGGTWTLTQTNGVSVSVNLHQRGSRVTGTAVVQPGGPQGEVRGNVNGRQLKLRMDWSARSAGFYSGSINETGRASGRTWDASAPAAGADWTSDGPFGCR
jgi:hypothetical protein